MADTPKEGSSGEQIPQVHHIKFPWKITEFIIRGVSVTRPFVQSIWFWPKKDVSTKICLRLYPFGLVKKKKENIYIQLHSSKLSKYASINVNFSIHSESVFEKENVLVHQLFSLGKRAQILEDWLYDENTTLIINCNIDLIEKSDLKKLPETGKILNKGLTSNIVSIKCKEGSLSVHSDILKARSSVLEAMLTTDMVEKSLNEILIPDIRYEVMRQLIVYLYSDFISDYNEATKELFIAADKYDIRCLRNKLEELFIENIDSENYYEILGLSQQFNMKQVSIAVTGFLQDTTY